MERARKELIARLFVFATELLEDTHPYAIRGQSPKSRPKDFVDCAERLRGLAQALDAIARVVLVLPTDGPTAHEEPGKKIKRD